MDWCTKIKACEQQKKNETTQNQRIQYARVSSCSPFFYWILSIFVCIVCELEMTLNGIYIYIRSSGFNVAHTRIHILFYQFGCTSHCSILVLDLAQYVERFSFTEFNFISFYSFCTTYLCHFHYFIILYQFFRPVVCVCVCVC